MAGSGRIKLAAGKRTGIVVEVNETLKLSFVLCMECGRPKSIDFFAKTPSINNQLI